MLLGVIGISEGAIPFILKNPRLIPVFMTGAVAGALIAIALGVKQTLPLPAIWGWPLATNVVGYGERLYWRTDLRPGRALCQPKERRVRGTS